MEFLDAFLKLMVLVKDYSAGAGAIPAIMGGMLLALALFMKVGKYHLEHATSMSQIGSSAIGQLQEIARLNQTELANTRAALKEAIDHNFELTTRLHEALEEAIHAERMAAQSDIRVGRAESLAGRLRLILQQHELRDTLPIDYEGAVEQIAVTPRIKQAPP